MSTQLHHPPQTPVPEMVRRFDRTVERWFTQVRRRPALDRLAYGLSEAGNHSRVWHGINLVDAVVGPAITGDPTRRRRAIRRSALQGIEQAVVNGPVKLVFRRQRPVPLDDHPHDLRVPQTSSFPSGHSSAGACAATLLSLDLGHPVLWYSLATAIGWSRVHVGVHHPSDVVGGAVIGLALAAVASAAWPPPARPAAAPASTPEPDPRPRR